MPQKGYKQTSEHIAKARLPKLGKPFPYSWLGKKRTEKFREWHRNNAPMKNPETVAKVSRALKGRKLSQDARLKMSLAKKGKPKPRAWIEKMKQIRNERGSFQHVMWNRILEEVPELEKQGFKCIPLTRVLPDIIALKDGKIYAIEVEYGTPNYCKYELNNFKNLFEDIIWIIRKKNKDKI